MFLSLLLLIFVAQGQAQNNTTASLFDYVSQLREEVRIFKIFLTQTRSLGSCEQLYQQGQTKSGEYYIRRGDIFVKTYCHFDGFTGGNWLVIQRRLNGELDFYRNWKNYTQGFGNLSSEFWLGLEKLHTLFCYGSYTLRVELEDFDGKTAYAEYSEFNIAGPDEKYAIRLGSYSGDAGDSMTYHNFYPFSTYDKDNDEWSGNCAVERQSGWWFKKCSYANLNGIYFSPPKDSLQGVFWFKWKNSGETLKLVEMKVRKN